MQLQELKGRVQHDGYAVDAPAVAEALLARMGHQALASALGGHARLNPDDPTPPGRSGARSRADARPARPARPGRPS